MVEDHVPFKRPHAQLPLCFPHLEREKEITNENERQRARKRKGRARERKKAYRCCLSQGCRRTSTSLLSKAPVAALCARERSAERESTIHRHPKALAEPTSHGQGSSMHEEPLSCLSHRRHCHQRPLPLLPSSLKPRSSPPHVLSIA